MPHEKLYPKFTLTEEKFEELKKILPEAFTDGKINWESLRESLGEFLEEEQESEHFGLFWPGKRDSKILANIPTSETLFPARKEGINDEKTRNLFIEGENLEVLKILQKSYPNKVKFMYFDPPYNTGNDFIYDDDYTETIDEYFKRTGQVDEEGNPMKTNKKSDGRFHSKWLTMMYPRLKLSKNLLKNDGIVFISIDDNEVHNLRQIMNEIYGEENFIAQLIWKKKYTGGKHAKFYVDLHEYILVYAKSVSEFTEISIDRWEEEKGKFAEVDEYLKERGKYYTRPLKSNLEERKTLVYPITFPDGSIMKTQWLIGEDRFEKEFAEGRVIFKMKKNGEYQVYKKYYEFDNDGKIKPDSLILRFPNNDAKIELKNLFDIKEGRENLFYTIKPKELIKYLISQVVKNNDIVLDIFAGSGTTAQAVLELNEESNGSIKFILVQIAEITDVNTEAYNAGYKTIAELCKERIRRVIKKINLEKNTNNLDRGFRVFKQNKSNYKAWQNYQGEDITKLETLFESFESPLVEKWKLENLTSEIILLEGFPLDSIVEKLEEFRHNDTFKVTSDFHEHKLLICLDKKIKKGTIEHLDLNDKDVFICLDSAISDEEKMTLSDKGVIKTI